MLELHQGMLPKTMSHRVCYLLKEMESQSLLWHPTIPILGLDSAQSKTVSRVTQFHNWHHCHMRSWCWITHQRRSESLCLTITPTQFHHRHVYTMELLHQARERVSLSLAHQYDASPQHPWRVATLMGLIASPEDHTCSLFACWF